MKIALAQMKMVDNKDHNLKKSLDYIREAANNGADLIVFPETQLTKFFPQYLSQNKDDFAITENSEYFKKILESAKENNIIVSPNFYIKESGKYYDKSYLIDRKGKVLGSQKMVHIASFPNFYEQDYYSPSEEGFNVIQTKEGNIGVVVCFDRHFPESIRTEVINGADLILIPTANTKDEPEDLFKYEIIIQAFQNEVPIVMCNRSGIEDQMNFSGNSIVVDSNGEILLYAPYKEGLYYATVEINKNKQKKYLPLRRKDNIYS